MKKNNYILLLLLLLFFYPDLSAQLEIQRSVIASAGSNVASSGQLSTSWTAGEAVIGSEIAGTITLTSGFQQADASGRVAVDNPSAGINFTVYPNPTYGEINIKVESTEAQSILYDIYNTHGQRLSLTHSEMVVKGSRIERFSIASQPAGTYYLSLRTKRGEPLGTIKIIKIK